jgi:Coenzyme F420-dependent N5,N10-methylene tetrahydromethanopterin reductase and related flavin-dependent oxidoreductases
MTTANCLKNTLKIRASEKVTWRGGHRPAIDNLGVYPRSVQDPLPVWIGTGGRPESAIRAGALGLPIVFAIIGGKPERFAPLVELYKQAAARAGHVVSKLEYVVEKILLVHKNLGTNRFFLHLNIGTLPHREVLRAIELFGTRVAPIVRKEIARES